MNETRRPLTSAESLPESELRPSAPLPRTTWSPGTRFLFRFAFIYICLYISVRLIWYLPLLSTVGDGLWRIWEVVVPWVGVHVLHWWSPYADGAKNNPNGTFQWVQLVCVFVIAVVGATMWSLFQRDARAQNTLHRVLRLVVRYSLCLTMTSYAISKFVGDGQFGYPSLHRLMTPVGDLAPAGLLWTFLGYSFAYGVVLGLIELMGALLLLSERTTTLGALVVLASAFQISLFNIFYDMSGSQFPVHLMLLAIVLLIPDARVLANVLVLQRPTTPRTRAPIFATQMRNRALQGALAVYIVYALLTQVNEARAEGDVGSVSPVRGIYEVETFVRNGDTIPPLTTDASRWRRLVIESSGYAIATLMTDTVRTFVVRSDTTKHQLSLVAPPESLDTPAFGGLAMREAERADADHRFTVSYSAPSADHMLLDGAIGHDSVAILLRRRNEADLLLTRWGMHLVNNIPMGVSPSSPYAGFPIDPRNRNGPRRLVP